MLRLDEPIDGLTKGAEIPKTTTRLQCGDCGEIGNFAMFEAWTPTTLFKCPHCGSVKAVFKVLNSKRTADGD
jgi:DNA-directed RNA polymerase subunit M/transcription elongation factor TFIIS